MHDQDIGQEQYQKRIEPENEINNCKFYITKSCKHGLRGNNYNYPHLAPCKKYIENPEYRCGAECTNYQPDICKYSMQFRKCYNVRCHRIYLKGTMCKKSPQEQHQALSHSHINQFHNHNRLAHSTFAIFYFMLLPPKLLATLITKTQSQ